MLYSGAFTFVSFGRFIRDGANSISSIIFAILYEW